MAVLKKDELMNKVKAIIGDDTSDNALSFLGDLADTVDDYEKRSAGDGEDWKKKYEDNDAEWRKKYKERFFSAQPVAEQDDKKEPDTPEPQAKTEYDELFK